MRPRPEELADNAEIEEAVAREIKRRRGHHQIDDAPITLTEKRAFDRSTIMKQVKENKNLVVRWSDMIISYHLGEESKPFMNINSADDFIDGAEF